MPLVLDAEGINALAGKPDFLKKRKQPTVITPHEAELARLLGWETSRVREHRVGAVEAAVQQCACTVVLKGYRTLIGTPDGKIYVNPTGNYAMATAGAGDVLAGLIAGLLAQKIPLEEAVLGGVYLHGLAGDMAAENLGNRGLIASDLISCFPKARQLVCHSERSEESRVLSVAKTRDPSLRSG